MEFTEMEKRMLYQTEGSERYAILQEKGELRIQNYVKVPSDGACG